MKLLEHQPIHKTLVLIFVLLEWSAGVKEAENEWLINDWSSLRPMPQEGANAWHCLVNQNAEARDLG